MSKLWTLFSRWLLDLSQSHTIFIVFVGWHIFEAFFKHSFFLLTAIKTFNSKWEGITCDTEYMHEPSAPQGANFRLPSLQTSGWSSNCCSLLAAVIEPLFLLAVAPSEDCRRSRHVTCSRSFDKSVKNSWQRGNGSRAAAGAPARPCHSHCPAVGAPTAKYRRGQTGRLLSALYSLFSAVM